MKTPIYTGIFESDLDASGYKLVGLPAPVASGDAANKAYVDAHAGGGGGSSGLDANTVTAASIGMVGDGVTDNTTALQTWLNAVGASKVSSTLLVPDGIYIFSGPLQDISGNNSQIILPSIALSEPAYSVTIKGYHAIAFNPWPGASVPVPRAAIFKSTLATGSGTQPSFISGRGPSTGVGSASGPITFIHLCFENMIFQTVADPQISCLNLSYIGGNMKFGGDVGIIAGTGVGFDDVVPPTHSTSYGLLLTPNNSGILQEIENLYISNFYTGVYIGEYTSAQNLGCTMCIYGMEFGLAHHSAHFVRASDWGCTNGIRVTGTHGFVIEHYDVEREATGFWYSRVFDIDDPSNLATADITWWTVVAYVGATADFTVNGGSGIKARRIGTVYP